MSKVRRLIDLKLPALKILSTAIGSKLTGTKAVLLEQLEHSVRSPKLPPPTPSPAAREKCPRVLSMDMGIQNLAFCVCDVSISNEQGVERAPLASKSTKDSFGSKTPLKFSVVAWKRMAVNSSALVSSTNDSSTNFSNFRTSHSESPEEESQFTPRAMSQIAYTLIKNLLQYKPDTILIERQRFRSNNSPAVQEWTLRVNMLEAMLWAVLTTLKNERNLADRKSEHNDESDQFPSIWEVSPKKVSTFWLPTPTGGRKKDKEVKREKTLLVKKWIENNDPDDSNEPRFSFPDEALPMIEAFKPPKAGRKSRGETVGFGKMDDLADCLLQAATWVKWEQNRRALLPLMEAKDVDGIEEWIEEYGEDQ
jgi:cruciform cutting endonuclease 1